MRGREKELFWARQIKYNLHLDILDVYVNVEDKIKRGHNIFRKMISEWKAKIAFTISEVIEFYFRILSPPTELTEFG